MEKQILDIMETVFQVSGLDTSVSQHTCEKWDSLNHLNLIVALEDAFDVEFDPEEIGQMKNFSAVRDMLNSKLG